MQFFLYFLAIPFLFFNYKIVISDLKYKKIPNKYLGYLLLLIPFYYIYILLYFPEINYILFLWQIILTFLVSFILYYFWIWAAWDAKYLLVLSLFIPYIWIIPFFWNIAILTMIYLFWYFIYFYLWKLTFNKKYKQGLLSNIKQDLNERWSVYKGNKWWKTYTIILKFLIIFLLIFVSIRLSRIYIFNEIFSQENNRNIIFQNIVEKYSIYLIFLWIIIFIIWLYLFKLLINKFKIYVSKKLKLNISIIWNILLLILAIFLISFIIISYNNNAQDISNVLFNIFTIYLLIYLTLKILFYSYKITFWIAEVDYINIKELKEGDIIDKKYLITIFWDKSKQIKEELEKKKEDEFDMAIGKLTWNNINKYINELDICLNKTDLNIIKKIFYLYLNKKINPVKYIKIIKTFSFAPYIFIWFLITFLFWDFFLKYLINIIIKIVENFY